jgi:PIN domain nuclease of toxin-antitoxin system
MVLLDTHIWIWWLSGLPQLDPKYRRALQRLSSPPFLSSISLWELSVLVEHSRVHLAPTAKEWLTEATQPDAVRLVQIDSAIAEELLSLPSTLPRDPADRIIVATARHLDVPLLTVDRPILRSGAIRAWNV